MIVSMIAAMAKNRVIGVDNRLPWRMPADLKHFKESTMGKPMIMGRKTFESFGSRPLPGRLNIILTANPEYRAEDAVVVSSMDEALAAGADHPEIMVIGGSSLYEQFLPRAQRLYLTFIDAAIEGDSFFPDYDVFSWQEITRRDFPADEKNPYNFSFVLLERLD